MHNLDSHNFEGKGGGRGSRKPFLGKTYLSSSDQLGPVRGIIIMHHKMAIFRVCLAVSKEFDLI